MISSTEYQLQIKDSVMVVVGLRELRGKREPRAVVATVPRRHSAAGTVHVVREVGERRLGFWVLGTPAAGLRPRPAREKGFLLNVLLDFQLIHLLTLYRDI